MESMSLVVFAETNHVLCAFTRAAAPDAAVEAVEVVGEGVWIRDGVSGRRLLTVEHQHLKVETVERHEPVLGDCRRYSLVDGAPVEQPKAAGLAVALAGNKVTLNVPNPATEELTAWVQVEGGPSGAERHLVKVKVAAGSSSGEAPLTLPAGDYETLALVPGFRPETASVTV